MSIETTLWRALQESCKANREWEAAFNEAVDGAMEWKKTAEVLAERCDKLREHLEAETDRADANYDDFIQLDQEYGELVEQYQAKGKALDRQIAINEAHLRWIEGCTNWLGEHTGWWLKLLAHHGWDKPGTSTTYREIKSIYDAYHEVGTKYPWQGDDE
jgi:hypothetical protein